MENNGKKYVVGLGEALWDKTLKKEIQEKSGMSITECLESKELFNNEDNFTKNPGGAPANFAYHVAQWLDEDDIKILVVSSVGRDKDGNELNAFLRENGLNEVPQIEGYKTGEVWIVLDEKGDPSYDIKEGAYDHIPFDEPLENGLTLQEIAENCCTVCFGSLAQRKKDSRDTVRKFLQATPDECLKIFDINLRQNHYSKQIIKESLNLCNVLKINKDELVKIGQMFDLSHLKELEDKCKELIKKFNLKMLILTCDEKCSYIFTKDLTSYQDTPLVKDGGTTGEAYLEDNLDRPKIVKKMHAVGAGDSFTGSFIAAILNSKTKIEDLDFETIKRFHKLAVQVSAFVCTEEGAMPEIPNYIRKYEKRLRKEQEAKDKKNQ